MNATQIFAAFEAVRGSITGERTFADIVAQLHEIGIERYHADYCRSEKTFYLANGDSVVVSSPCGAHSLGQAFAADDIRAAIRESQRGEHSYLDFVRKTMAAGCVGYFVQITGRRAIYFGRNGEFVVEEFPK